MIKVTISIPVYKVEDYLRPCLDSVLGQTLKDIEVICVDDASPDGCAAILDEYAAKDSRVRAIHLDVNRGQGYGRNLGIEQGRGKYIYFLDSDDEITPDAMEQLFEKAEKEDLDGIFFDSEVVFESEELSVKHASYPAARKGTYPEGAVRGTELFDAFMRQGPGFRQEGRHKIPRKGGARGRGLRVLRDTCRPARRVLEQEVLHQKIQTGFGNDKAACAEEFPRLSHRHVLHGQVPQAARHSIGVCRQKHLQALRDTEKILQRDEGQLRP